MTLSDDLRTSSRLTPGAVYTREDLKARFGIQDATINTGVFRPKGHMSVWLFVTENKPTDRTQYKDLLDGDTLYWQGQTSGRTDRQIIDHRDRGLELVLFYRREKYEHPGAGFTYVGNFEYVRHAGGRPTSFVLQRIGSQPTPIISAQDADHEPFDPENIEDARERVSVTIAQRRGQKAFRDALIDAYSGRCAITGCAVLDVLEAAHIVPYRGPATNRVDNGLLLRADIHTLFDCGLLSVDPLKYMVVIADSLTGTAYSRLAGRRLRIPAEPECQPSADTLKQHLESSKVPRLST